MRHARMNSKCEHECMRRRQPCVKKKENGTKTKVEALRIRESAAEARVVAATWPSHFPVARPCRCHDSPTCTVQSVPIPMWTKTSGCFSIHGCRLFMNSCMHVEFISACNSCCSASSAVHGQPPFTIIVPSSAAGTCPSSAAGIMYRQGRSR